MFARDYVCVRMKSLREFEEYLCLREYRYMMKKRVCIVRVKVLHKNK